MSVYDQTSNNIDYQLVNRQKRRAHVRAVLLRAKRQVAEHNTKVELSERAS
jgi:hypothetical protein